MDNFIPMICQTCGDRLQATTHQNRYRCPSCNNVYVINQDGGLIRADPKQEQESVADSQSTVGYIPIADAYITSLKIFTGAFEPVPTKERQYATQFQSNAEYIFWELTLDHPAIDHTLEFVIFTICYDPNSKSDSYSMKVQIEAGWAWSRWWQGTKRHIDGNKWMVGDYSLNLFVEGKQFTSSTFTIVD